MADETRVARTTGLVDKFVVGDTEITPAGVELTYEQWKTVRDAAFRAKVRVSLDEDFPVETVTADLDKESAPAPEPKTPRSPKTANGGTESKEG